MLKPQAKMNLNIIETPNDMRSRLNEVSQSFKNSGTMHYPTYARGGLSPSSSVGALAAGHRNRLWSTTPKSELK